MKEIKFRAWDKENKEWVYSKPMPDMGFWKWVSYDSTTIFNQYTGLKDKNGKEIYEGDILRRFEERVASDEVEPDSSWIDIRKVDNFEYMSGNKGTRYFGHEIKKVYWSDKSCGFEPFSDSEDNCGHCGGSDSPTDWEVIGNIWENPELLALSPERKQTEVKE